MRIAIDISQIAYPGGVKEYTVELVRNLLSIDKTDEYILFAGALRRKKDILGLFPEAKVFPIPPVLANVIWNRLHILPIEKLVGDIDILHTSDWSEPPSRAFKITTVHDLSPFLFPNLFPRDIIRNIVSTHKTKLALVREESQRVIVPTSATKDDLVKLGISDEKIRVIPEAASSFFRKSSAEDVEKVRRKFKVFGKYLFTIGVNPRKNTDRLIQAFELSRAGKDIKLVIAGEPKYMDVKPLRNVMILGRVSSEDLVELYSGAEALVYPSLYEGFGLPILQAFACGIPVVTSNTSSMKEIAGNAAALVDPYEVDSIKEGIESVLRGPKAFVDGGYKRVKDFSWKKTAEMTLGVYEEAKR